MLSTINDSAAFEAGKNSQKFSLSDIGLSKFGQIAFPFIISFQFFQKAMDFFQVASSLFVSFRFGQGDLSFGKTFPDGQGPVRVVVGHCFGNVILLIPVMP